METNGFSSWTLKAFFDYIFALALFVAATAGTRFSKVNIASLGDVSLYAGIIYVSLLVVAVITLYTAFSKRPTLGEKRLTLLSLTLGLMSIMDGLVDGHFPNILIFVVAFYLSISAVYWVAYKVSPDGSLCHALAFVLISISCLAVFFASTKAIVIF